MQKRELAALKCATSSCRKAKYSVTEIHVKNPVWLLFIGSMFGCVVMMVHFNTQYILTSKKTDTALTATTPAKLDVIEGSDHTSYVVYRVSEFQVVRTADAWALYRRGEDAKLFVDVVATADRSGGLDTLRNAKALFRAYGTQKDLERLIIDDRVKDREVSVSEIPGKDWVTAPAQLDAVYLARIVQWYWTPLRATRLAQ